MKNLFSASALARLRRLKPAALTLGLLAGASSPALAQIPSTIYVLGKTIGATPATNNNPVVLEANPANLATAAVGDLYVAGSFHAITGLVSNSQPLLAIDVRPRTGQVYALGYNSTTQLAQLYTLNVGTYALTTVGGPIALDLRDTNNGPGVVGGGTMGNTLGQTVNIGFDFNPRLDRIRVVAPNGTNYVLNPNTGTLQATNTSLSYTATGYTSRTPYIGAAAYSNSQLGLAGTTLYDLDIANTDGLLARQNTPDNGTLDQAGPLRFALRQSNNNGAYNYGSTGTGNPLNSPTYRLDIDVSYDRANGLNHFYVLEGAYRNATSNSVNLYEVSQDVGTSNSVSATPITAGMATGRFIAQGENITGINGYAFYDIAAFTGFPKTWTGQAGTTEWANGGNWYPTGVPTQNDDVLVPGIGTFVATANFTVQLQPTVSGTQNAGSLTLSDGAVLTLANGSTLNDYGNFTNNESSVAGDATATNGGTGTLALAGNTTQEINGTVSTTFPNLSVGASGATTASDVQIQRSVTVSGTLAIGSGQAFTLLSSGTTTTNNTAYVVNNAGGTITGSATVQRYISSANTGPGYRHYSTPVTGNAVSDFAVTGVFTPSANDGYNSAPNPRQFKPYPNVFTYDQSRLASGNAGYAVGDFDNGFRSPASTATLLTPGLGYSVNISGGALVDFQGTLNQNANYPFNGLARGAQAAAGYQFLGNPYPGAINYDAVISNPSTTNMESALYVYRSNGQYVGSYSTYVPAGATNGGPGASVNGGTSNIPLGQGFFMRTAAGRTGSVNFNTGARTNQPETALFQRTASTLSTVALTLSNATTANQMRVYFVDGATSAFDDRYDAHYLPATHGLDLASDIGTEALAINGLPTLTSTVTVPLRVHALTAGTYTLIVDELANLPAGYSAYLRDGSTGTYTDLATTPSVSLTLNPADAATGRYAVVFATSTPLANAPAVLAALVGVYPNPAHGAATLVLPQALRGQAASEVQIVNTLGQVVLRRTVAAASPEAVELPLNGLAAGIYTVRATTASGAVAKQLRVE